VEDVYESVFTEGKHVTGPRLPGGATLEEPFVLPGNDRHVRAEHADVPKPVVSRRAMLAREATDGTSRAFNENLANRLWAHMMGRGLVAPVDLHHSSNPPTHPELLRVLGERLAEMKFNVRTFLRELALAEVYQRAIDPPDVSEDVAVQLKARSEEWAADVERREAIADASAEVYQSAQDAFVEAETPLLPAVEDFQAKRVSLASAVQKHQEAAKAAEEAASKLAAQSEILQVVEEACDKAEAVVEKLSGDEALAAAAKTFSERAESLTTEIATLQAAVQEKTAARDQVAAEVAAATMAAQAAVDTLDPLKQNACSLEEELVEARQQMLDDYSSYERRAQESQYLETFLTWSDLRQELATTHQQIAAQEEQLRETQREQEQIFARQQELSRAAAGANEALQSHSAEVHSVQQQLDTFAGQVAKLGEALAKINEVRGSVGPDGSLDAAATQLDSKVGQIQSDQTVREAELEQARMGLDAAQAELAEVQQAIAATQAALEVVAAKAQAVASDLEAVKSSVDGLAASADEKWQELLAAWHENTKMRPLEQLSPEQLCWSMLQATGVYERTWQQEAAELDKQEPLAGLSRLSPLKWLKRSREIEARTYDKLKGNLPLFVQIYGAGAGQPQSDFFASAEQALFVSNGPAVMGWTAPADRNVTARMLEFTEPEAMAAELYLSVLNRLPADDEIAAANEYVNQRPAEQRTAAVRDVVWGLLTSAEFRFNH
jgi:hypothetical protein